MDTLIIPFLYFMFCTTIGIIAFFRMRSIVESKGETLNYLFPYFDLLDRFYWIMKGEKNPRLKKEYKWIFWILILFIPGFIAGMILIMTII